MPDEPAYAMEMSCGGRRKRAAGALGALTPFEGSLEKEEHHFAAMAGDRGDSSIWQAGMSDRSDLLAVLTTKDLCKQVKFFSPTGGPAERVC
jgi:hypothetical protein